MKKQLLILFLAILPLFANADDSGYCGNKVNYSYVNETKTLTISGSGDMTNYSSFYEVPWYNYHGYIREIVIESGVTSIGNYAFFGIRITSLDIPNSVTYIGSSSMSQTTLTYLTIPSGVTDIGEWAFSGSSLKSIVIPKSVVSIGEGALSGCYFLSSIDVDKDNSIYDSRDNCNAIVETKTNTLVSGCSTTFIPNSIYAIGPSAFSSNNALVSVNIPGSVSIIGKNAFYQCANLESVTIGNGVTSIGEWAFMYCSKIESLTMPNSVTSIGRAAFRDCTKLRDIKMSTNIESVGVLAFDGSLWLNNHEDGEVYVGKVLYAYKGIIPENTKIIIKNGTVSINPSVFYKGKNICSVEFPNSLRTIGNSAFASCI